jgi:Helicase conserved C-terminal domain
MLVPAERTFFRELHLSGALWSNPQRKAFQEAVLADQDLSRLFVEESEGGGWRGMVYRSTGSGGGLQLWTLPDLLLTNAWWHGQLNADPSRDALAATLVSLLDLLRRASRGEPCQVKVLWAFTGIVLDGVDEIELPFGSLRPVRDHERDLAPPSLEGRVSHTAADGGSVTASYAGDVVLERALWRHIPKDIPTQVLTGDERPPSLRGIVCATVTSAIRVVESGWRPGLVVVDEAHHVPEVGRFQILLDTLEGAWLLGVTATPWRGDGYSVSRRFGEPVFRMGIADGMAAGFLAQVDYRLFIDAELNWDEVTEASELGLTIKDLNRQLFLPQRDEVIIDTLRDAWSNTIDPRAIVFCRTINHAEEFAQLLRASGWRRAAALSARQPRRDRNILMSEFRDGRVPIVAAVDVLNEGVDVPDVNILGFLRVTHSRRIFVQQLGRGLRLRQGKEQVIVLDFVSDIRRVAATLNLQHDLERLRDDEIERLTLPESTFRFSEPSIGSLLAEWIQDAASLEDAEEEVRL